MRNRGGLQGGIWWCAVRPASRRRATAWCCQTAGRALGRDRLSPARTGPGHGMISEVQVPPSSSSFTRPSSTSPDARCRRPAVGTSRAIPPSAAGGGAGGAGQARLRRVLRAGVEPERQRTFPASTYLSPILLGTELRRMGERYVHVTKVRSRSAPDGRPDAAPRPQPPPPLATRSIDRLKAARDDHSPDRQRTRNQPPRSPTGIRPTPRTDLGAEPDRSRRGSEPISATRRCGEHNGILRRCRLARAGCLWLHSTASRH